MSGERTEPDKPSWMALPLRRLTTWIVARPGLTLGVSLGITLLAILVTASGLRFKMSRLDLLNPKSEYNQRWLAYLKEFGDQDDAVVVVQGTNTDDVLTAIDDLAEELKGSSEPFEAVLSEWDLSSLRKKALHFLPPDAIQQLERRLDSLSAVADPARLGDPLAALKSINDRLAPIERLPVEPAREAEQQYQELLTALAQSLSGGQALSEGNEPFATGSHDPLRELEQGFAQFKSHHLLMNDGTMGFVLLRLKEKPGEASRGAAAITRLREILASAEPRHPDVQIGVTGMPILEYDEMTASQSDMARSTWLSFVCVLLFFWASFGSWKHTLLANAALAIGMAWSFGYLTLAIGHLNILSVAFAAILIGIGIDFSIHYVSHYLNYRARGMASGPALIQTATYVGPGVVTGAVTTALAFFTAALTEFVGIVELGVIAGGGILLCLVATVVTLPAMIELLDRRSSQQPVNDILHVANWLSPAKYFPKATMAVAVLVTLVLGWGLTDVRYDHNLLNLQPNHLESVQIEREVLGGKDQSFWCALTLANSPEHARQLRSQFESLETVARVEEVASLLPIDDPAARKSIAGIERLLNRLTAKKATAPLGLGPLLQELARAELILARSVHGQSALLRELQSTQQQLQAVAKAQQLRHQQFAQTLSKLESLALIARSEPPQLQDLPQAMRDRYVGGSGRYLVKVYAKGHIWNMDALKRFVADVESVDPAVTGHPVQTFYASRHMQKSYLQAGMYSLLCVVGVLLLDYRNVWHTALAMLPLLLGVAQMLGLMGLLGIPFNPANMIALPLILGMGVEDGVHLVHEYRKQRGRFQLGNSTAMAVMLTSATTMSGFACMIVSRHQGLRSLGQILTFGMTTCMLVSLYALPALLRWMTRHRPEIADEADDVLPAAGEQAMLAARAPASDMGHTPSGLIRPRRAA